MVTILADQLENQTTPEPEPTRASSPVPAPAPTPASAVSAKDPTVVGVVSLIIPGIGQILNGHIKKGICLFGGWLLCFVILFVANVGFTIVVSILTAGVGGGLGVICCADYIIPFAINLFAAYEAYTTATKIKSGGVVADWFPGIGKA